MFDLTNFYYEGNLDISKKGNFFFLAIVGSRNILPYTEYVLDSLFEVIQSFQNIVIVSGGMYGFDLYSHNLALKYGLGTIIFLPCGIGAYKKSNLYNSLRKNYENSKYGLVSKYPSNFSSRKYTYLERNRQIVDFSNVVLVAQSGEKSGSIYSGIYSINTSKITFSIPISLNNKQFQGNNLLLSKGAKIYLNPDRFINECGLNYENVPSLNNLLEFLPISKDELFKKFPDADIGLLEKILLEGILKGEIFYLDSLIFKKDD